MNIKEALEKANKILIDNNIEENFLKARILLSHELGCSKEYLITHDDEEISDDIEKSFFEKITRLTKGEPIQYLTNKAEFMGLDFYVDKNVLIPQPDTEILVQAIIDIVKENEIEILDLCTGSGAIGISLCKNLTNAKIFASDISEIALEVAKKNANFHNAEIEFIKSDLFCNIKGKFDIIVSNPPYIETAEIDKLSKEVKNEPKIALDGGIDGLDFYRNISNNAQFFLENNGILAVEIGYNQGKAVEEMFINCGFKNVKILKDLSQNDRVVIGEKI